jgi:hypothetical protein
MLPFRLVYSYLTNKGFGILQHIKLLTPRLVIGTSRTVGSAKKFVRITSGFGGGEFTKTLDKKILKI